MKFGYSCECVQLSFKLRRIAFGFSCQNIRNGVKLQWECLFRIQLIYLKPDCVLRESYRFFRLAIKDVSG